MEAATLEGFTRVDHFTRVKGMVSIIRWNPADMDST